MRKPLCCAVLGCHPLCFAWGFDEEDDGCRALKLELVQQILTLHRIGVKRFMVACDPGVGLYAAEAINILRESGIDMALFCATPYEEQATKWAPYLRDRYFEMLEKCTDLCVVGREQTPTAQLDAYKKIIRQSDIVLAVYDWDSTESRDIDLAVRYAASQNAQWYSSIQTV